MKDEITDEEIRTWFEEKMDTAFRENNLREMKLIIKVARILNDSIGKTYTVKVDKGV